MAQKVAIPAALLQKYAAGARQGVKRLREEGHTLSAEKTQAAVEIVEGMDMPENIGQLVSIDARMASALTADGALYVNGTNNDGMRTMLEHQHYW